jgi:hypothetical protein
MQRLWIALFCSLPALGGGAPGAPPPPMATPPPLLEPLPPPAPYGCLPGGNGYFKARIRGAFNLDVDWHNSEMECQGALRPDGTGLRVSFAGPAHGGRRLRLVFGVSAVQEGHAGHDLPTNLTVIQEGEHRLFATRGDDHCTVDDLRQERLGAQGSSRTWRIVARGFCIAPASALNGDARILVSRFDFAGSAAFSDPPRPQLYRPNP